MLRLTVLGGAHEVGGNKILLDDHDRRLLLDFGISYARRTQFFAEYLRPRTAAGLTDLLVTGVLPSVAGLYRRDLLEVTVDCSLPLHDTPTVEAVLLSHPHLDHAGHIGFLDERISTFCSPIARRTLEAMQGSRGRDFEAEFVDFILRPAFREARASVPRLFQEVQGEFTAGGFRSRIHAVDHSILGSAAFLLRTSRGNIFYTGDLRFHGPEAGLSEATLEAARAEGVWLLLTEGTRLDVTDRRTEADVYVECLAAVRETPGPVIADFAPRDLYRLGTFLRIARETDRSLVILPQDAHLLEHLLGHHPLVPDPRLEPILILKERKGSGTYVEKDYAKWERRVFDWPTVRTAGELRAIGSRLILALSYWDINNLVDLGVGEDALHIYSASEAWREEQARDRWRLRNWLTLLGVRRRLQSHASGHAPQPDLVRMVKALRPEILVPIHTEVPGLWRDLVSEPRIIEPSAGVPLVW